MSGWLSRIMVGVVKIPYDVESSIGRGRVGRSIDPGCVARSSVFYASRAVIVAVLSGLVVVVVVRHWSWLLMVSMEVIVDGWGSVVW